jgi:hypothetical protein
MVDEGQAAADAAPPSTTRSRRPEEFAALADYAVDDFMSEAASEVEVFSTTEGISVALAKLLFDHARTQHSSRAYGVLSSYSQRKIEQ